MCLSLAAMMSGAYTAAMTLPLRKALPGAVACAISPWTKRHGRLWDGSRLGDMCRMTRGP
jgi:hypothetical protein